MSSVTSNNHRVCVWIACCVCVCTSSCRCMYSIYHTMHATMWRFCTTQCVYAFEFNPSELQPSIIHWKLQNCTVACWLLIFSARGNWFEFKYFFFTFHVFTVQNTTQRESVCVCYLHCTPIRKSPGGVYFALVKTVASSNEKREIFRVDKLQKERRKKTIKKKTDRTKQLELTKRKADWQLKV